MGKYLDIIRQAEGCAALTTKTTLTTKAPLVTVQGDLPPLFGRLNRFCRTFAALESHCPELVPIARWQQCVEDGQRFLATWGEQAERLGWTSRDLFGLFPVPANPHPSFARLSRYDQTGVIWLLQGHPIIALTEMTAAIQNPTGTITIYRKHNKPALGPPGDSLNDFK